MYSQLEKECIVACDRHLLQMVRNVLERNNIAGDEFSEAIRNLLGKGRGKYRNLYLKGPSNCGKSSFLLNPLASIYNTFCNPASTTFAWVGAEEAEVLFLSDFRWSANIIPWHDLLLLLEGHEVHLPAPKTHYRFDFSFKLIERTVAAQLVHYIDENNLSEKLQSAYKKQHSTETALLKVHDDIL